MKILSTPHLKMGGKSISIILFFLFFLFFPLKLFSAEKFLIVEVQIAGEKASNTSNDYIRIYNSSSENLDISGFKLRKRSSTGSESSIRVFPSGSKVSAKNYFLWANSKDDFHLSVRANLWSTDTLAKNNSIALLGPKNVILDALSWGKSQNPFVEGLSFPENPEPNQRLKRKKIGQIYQDTNNNTNDFQLNPISKTKTEIQPKEEPRPEIPQLKPQSEQESKSLKESKPIIYSFGVIINEVLPSPEGPDEIEEWIEVFNQNSFEADLSGWKIEDTAGKTTTYVFPKGTKIKPRSFLTLFRPTTKITLNNSRDGLRLIQPNGKIIDSVSYEKAPQGQSYNRIPLESSNEDPAGQIPPDWAWSSTLTLGLENIIPTQKTETTEAISQLKPPKIEKEIKSSEKGLATVVESFNQGYLNKKVPKSLFAFLIALAIAIFSGVIILTLKKKLKAITVK